MGGYGSGWQGSKKATVEGSLVLTAFALVRKKAIVPGARTSGAWGWTYDGDDRPHANIGYEADLRDQGNAWLRLYYRANGEPVDYRVQLVTTTRSSRRRAGRSCLPCWGGQINVREEGRKCDVEH